MTQQGAKAKIKRRQAVSGVWLIPLFAILVGAWFVYWEWQNRGFEVTVQFRNAEGLVAKKTKLRYRNIDVGEVEQVALSEDLLRVDVRLRVQHTIEDLLREDTQFWVVRPRISSGGVSGLSTLLSGAYISMSAGDNTLGEQVEFVGLEEPPITPASVPGRRVELVSEEGDSLRVGQPIHYNGFRVGKIEKTSFDAEFGQLKARAFIESPYHELLTEASRFWRTGGVGIETGSGGLKLRTSSLETMLFGGVSFGLPEGVYPGNKIEDEHSFELFPDRRSIEINPYQHALYYLMLYPGTVRGLQVGAPVDFRGTRVGNVEKVSFGLLSEAQLGSVTDIAFPVPILIRIEPARLVGLDTKEQLELSRTGMEDAVARGLRATVRQGNFITGDYYVSLEPLAEAGEDEIHALGNYTVMPSAISGIAQLTDSATAAFSKIEQLPVDQTIEELNASLLALKRTLWRADQVLTGVTEESPIYQDMQQTLTRVRGTLQNVDQLARTLKNRPSELIFSSTPAADPIPRKDR